MRKLINLPRQDDRCLCSFMDTKYPLSYEIRCICQLLLYLTGIVARHSTCSIELNICSVILISWLPYLVIEMLVLLFSILFRIPFIYFKSRNIMCYGAGLNYGYLFSTTATTVRVRLQSELLYVASTHDLFQNSILCFEI